MSSNLDRFLRKKISNGFYSLKLAVDSAERTLLLRQRLRQRERNLLAKSSLAMKVSIFSTKSYDRQFFTAANTQHQHELTFLEARLDRQTACLATNATAICVFVNDEVDLNTLEVLAKSGVNLIALRCAGYNNIDIIF